MSSPSSGRRRSQIQTEIKVEERDDWESEWVIVKCKIEIVEQ
jgi:hypothetical protein